MSWTPRPRRNANLKEVPGSACGRIRGFFFVCKRSGGREKVEMAAGKLAKRGVGAETGVMRASENARVVQFRQLKQ